MSRSLQHHRTALLLATGLFVAAMSREVRAGAAGGGESHVAPSAGGGSREGWRSRPAAQWIWAENAELIERRPEVARQKLDRLARDPFTFFRGNPGLWHRDLRSGALEPFAELLGEPLDAVWQQGDAHLGNFGVFEDGRARVRWEIQDFDEAGRGDWPGDLLRAGTSLAVARLDDPRSRVEEALLELASAYVRRVRELASGDEEELFDAESPVGLIAKMVKKAISRGRKALLAKRTDPDHDGRRLVRDASFSEPSPRESLEIAGAMELYREIRGAGTELSLLDGVVKVGKGVASLGRRVYLVLLEGESTDTGDEILLEIKEARAGSLSRGPADTDAPRFGPGERVRAAALALQGDPDRYLEAIVVGGVPFIVREDSPYEREIDLAELDDAKWLDLARVTGRALAQAHARSGEVGPLAERLEGRRKALAALLASFSLDYAGLVEADLEAFRETLP